MSADQHLLCQQRTIKALDELSRAVDQAAGKGRVLRSALQECQAYFHDLPKSRLTWRETLLITTIREALEQ